MDPRIRDHAEVLVHHSADIGAGDTVVVSAPPVAEDLAVAIYEELAQVGATPVMTYGGDTSLGADRAARAYLKHADEDDLANPDHLQALYEASDATIRVRAHENVTERADVASGKSAAYQKAIQETRHELLSTTWVLTQYPAPADAQLAGMSTAEYADFVYDAVNKDWDEQREHQAQMVEILDPADEVRIVSGDHTDLTMSVSGMKTLNDYGENNLPGGEVFTAPVPDSVEGTVLFDLPLYHQSKEIEDAYLEFENGEVTGYSASKNEDLLGEVIHTDPGARRLGELGIGMNRDIDRFTYNMLFDEKMGDTVHLAVGMAYEECVPDDVERNDSATHVDMIVDMSEDSRIEVDGETVQEDGTFVFEE
ncbi:aminopeptidase [Halocalculus aciditolerans]|uniref:Aminopeptidase n=1 Tax=Halocalculus aciditolerans TaxID=1383812 RepID=A0A830F7H9_9EURY|nr:aminopeptidase [Halocalculus aciditolerans]GGL46789.1 aminopeptidase [Halocalculus aciditolerans]